MAHGEQGSSPQTVSQGAQRYAQAAFELALEAGGLEAAAADAAAIAAAFAQSADLAAAARSPLIDVEDKVRAFMAVGEKIGLSPMGRNLVGVIARNGRASELPQIAAALTARVAAHKGLREVEIVSAKPLSEADAASIVAAVGAELGAAVSPKVSVDESLLGGFIVRIGARQYDASLKSKLARLKLALTAA